MLTKKKTNKTYFKHKDTNRLKIKKMKNILPQVKEKLEWLYQHQRE